MSSFEGVLLNFPKQHSIFNFKVRERAKTIINLVEKGYKQIIDISGTGTGKSTLIEQIEPEDKLFYVSSAHRSKSNIFEELESQKLNYFREILKLPVIEAVKEIVDIITNCGWDNFLNYLLSESVREVDRPKILGLVAAIFTSLPLDSEINVSSLTTLLNS